jgi:hypothetical protein
MPRVIASPQGEAIQKSPAVIANIGLLRRKLLAMTKIVEKFCLLV